jgi:hypothetical protein
VLEAEDMLASTDADKEILEQRKLDLRCNSPEQYKGTGFALVVGR